MFRWNQNYLKKNCFIEIYGEIVHISLQTAAKSCMNLTADQELTLVFKPTYEQTATALVCRAIGMGIPKNGQILAPLENKTPKNLLLLFDSR